MSESDDLGKTIEAKVDKFGEAFGSVVKGAANVVSEASSAIMNVFDKNVDKIGVIQQARKMIDGSIAHVENGAHNATKNTPPVRVQDVIPKER